MACCVDHQRPDHDCVQCKLAYMAERHRDHTPPTERFSSFVLLSRVFVGGQITPAGLAVGEMLSRAGLLNEIWRKGPSDWLTKDEAEDWLVRVHAVLFPGADITLPAEAAARNALWMMLTGNTG